MQTLGLTISIPEIPDFKLTDDQSFALNAIAQFLTSEKRVFGLFGYAGAGKSTIASLIARAALAVSKRVVFTAPTNKAVGVLKRIALEKGLAGVDFMTIHQLLGLAPVKQGQDRILKQVAPSYLHVYNLIFLDECSMVTAELWQKIGDAILNTLAIGGNRQLIVMGDPAQLPPVTDNGTNEKRSKTFSVPEKAVLKQVVRQGSGSPVLEFVTAARTALKKKKLFEPFSTFSADKKNGAFLVKESTLLKLAIKKAKNEFDRNPDCFRILCYTNERVAYWNSRIRAARYGADAPRFVVGERLIAKEPVIAPDGKTILVSTSTEVKVLAFAEDRYSGYKAWRLEAATDGGIINQMYVLHEDDKQKFEKDNVRLLNNAKKNPSLWKAWYNHSETFAKLLNCYALTVHNSQGSTFKEVGIDGANINLKAKIKNGSVRECNQLWYVAASRAQTRIFVS